MGIDMMYSIVHTIDIELSVEYRGYLHVSNAGYLYYDVIA